MSRFRRPSPALIVAVLALVVALMPPATAAVQRLAAGSVGTRELKGGAVTSAKVRNGSLQVADLSSAARPRLPRSYVVRKKGWYGASPGSLTAIASITLPPGTWAITAKTGTGLSGTNSQTFCTLDDGFEWDASGVAQSGTIAYQDQIVTALARVHYTTSKTMSFLCMGDGSTLGDIMMVATETL